MLKLYLTALLLLAACRDTGNSSNILAGDNSISHQNYHENYEYSDNKSNIFKKYPRISKFWIQPPDITLCTRSGVSHGRFYEAIRFWKSIGYEFGEVNIVKNDIFCNHRPFDNEIVITIITNETNIGTNLATTRVSFFSATKEIISATIFMIPGYANDRLILEHEIGHALGWNHFSRDGHIMNPNYRDTGSIKFRLNYTYYDRQIKEITANIK